MVVRPVMGWVVMLVLLLVASVAMVVGRWLRRFRMSWMLRRRLVGRRFREVRARLDLPRLL